MYKPFKNTPRLFNYLILVISMLQPKINVKKWLSWVVLCCVIWAFVTSIAMIWLGLIYISVKLLLSIQNIRKLYRKYTQFLQQVKKCRTKKNPQRKTDGESYEQATDRKWGCKLKYIIYNKQMLVNISC